MDFSKRYVRKSDAIQCGITHAKTGGDCAPGLRVY